MNIDGRAAADAWFGIYGHRMDVEKHIAIGNNVSMKFWLIESFVKDYYKRVKKPYTSIAVKPFCIWD
jgi:hypothetical protein